MNELLKEYGQSLIATLGTLGSFAIMRVLMFQENGLIPMLISLLGNGGC